jgi:hypothetical protein
MPTPSKPGTPDRNAVEDIRQVMEWQGNAVQTMVSSGKVSSGEWDNATELSVLIIGTLAPFRIKMEITHPWGRPLLHLLLTESTIKILSFSDKTFYLGETGKGGTLTILGIPMDPAIIWSFVRAYPALLPHFETVATAGDQITLLNERKENVQTVNFYPRHLYPRSSFFRKADTELFFSDYDETGSIVYARKIVVNNPRDKTRLVLAFDRITVNKTVPEELFEMDVPDQFQTIPLQEEGIIPPERSSNAP